MIIDAFSNKGKRESNQDAYIYGVVKDGEMRITSFHHNEPESFEDNTSFNEGTVILVVADGMGGLQDGERASCLTTIKFLDILEKHNDPTVKFDDKIRATVEELSAYVATGAQDSGSTIVGLLMTEGITVMFNVGDSKCIVEYNGEYHRTKDHVYGEEFKSNIITDYIGMEGKPDVRIEYFDGPVSRAILFSDGLNPSFLQRGNAICSADISAEMLCSEALDYGSDDNITCIRYIGRGRWQTVSRGNQDEEMRSLRKDDGRYGMQLLLHGTEDGEECHALSSEQLRARELLFERNQEMP